MQRIHLHDENELKLHYLRKQMIKRKILTITLIISTISKIILLS